MLEEVSLCFCKCFVTLIHVVGDGIRFVYHLCKFFVGSQQVFVGRGFFGQVVDIVVGGAVVSIVIAVPLLTQVVLRVAVVCTPAVEDKGMTVCLGNLFSQAGYIGLDVQLNIIITQRIAEYLFEDICAVQGILVRAGDEVINGDREGDAQSGQLLDCLLFVSSSV